MYFLQISDTHYLNDYHSNPDFFHDAFLNLTPMREKLLKIKETISKPLDFIIHCGDICHYGEPSDYENAKAIFQEVFPTVPLLVTTGNHDKRDFVQEVFYGEKKDLFVHKHEFNGLRVLSFDNTNTRAGVGEITEETCQWILHELQHPQDTILVCHHHCIPEQNPMVSACIHPLFQEILQKKEILAVLTGHTHCSFQSDFQSTPYFTVGAMSFQTKALEGGKMDVFDSSFCHLFSYDQGNFALESAINLGFEEYLGQVQRPS